MPKIVFMGAGSTIFAKNILGDSMLAPALSDSHIALYDVDAIRLEESRRMVETVDRNINSDRATVSAHLGVEQRRDALRGADYVVNAIQVGGYEPSTVIDFEVPKRFGLRQTIGDTLGIGGIFRGLRTIPAVVDFARDMQEVCPDALFLNYTNPMAIVTAAAIEDGGIAAVGLCHSVQVCASSLLKAVAMNQEVTDPKWRIAGINHMAWLLEISDNGRDLYPEIKERAAAKVSAARGNCHGVGQEAIDDTASDDLVRLEFMRHFGFYITESSEHFAEYTPYWIKSGRPELVEEFNIPLDEYPRRCVAQIEEWKKMSKDVVDNPNLSHDRTHEYGSYIMEAIESNTPIRVHGNVMNRRLITNLPEEACVEVPCLVDGNGVQGTVVGELPKQCAALNMTNINVQLLTLEAARTRSRDTVYQAAMLDPHTGSELTLDEIRELCDALFEAHGDMLPDYR